MNRYLLQLVLGLLPWCAFAASDFDEGVKAYHKENYEKAAQLFEAHLAKDSTDVSAYYNLGLAYHELKRTGKAIWAFEKVLKYAPNDADAREKMEISYTQLKKPIDWEPQLNRFTSALYSFRSQTWSVIAIILSCLVGLFIVQYARSKESSFRKLMLILSGLGTVLLIISIVIAAGSYTYSTAENVGIVTQESIPTFLESKEETPVKLIEGMRLEVIETLEDNFVRVKTFNGKNYLVKQTDFELI